VGFVVFVFFFNFYFGDAPAFTGQAHYHLSPTHSLQNPISTNGWVWWYVPVISATMEKHK
jgi:hypothetical protein